VAFDSLYKSFFLLTYLLRWNSRLNSLRSVIRQFDDVAAVLHRAGQSCLVEDIDVELLTTVSQFLQPFEDATKELEADHVPTLHKTVLWFYELNRVLSQPSAVQLMRSLNARASRFLREKFVIGIIHKVAIFLCPMYRRLMMFPPETRSDVLSSVIQYINAFPEPAARSGQDRQTPVDTRDSDHMYAPMAKRPYRFA